MKTSRRRFLGAVLALAAPGCVPLARGPRRVLVNDVQSALNPTHVQRILSVNSLAVLQRAIRQTAEDGGFISIAGGRHAMGGQQFLSDGVLLDTTGLNRVLSFDAERGTIEVEAGIQWTELLTHLLRAQRGRDRIWTFQQKQTGANRFCIGGALASNIHSRGLAMRPFIGDVESFTLVDAKGESRFCSRKQNDLLFRLAIGGYGLFGSVYSVMLRLVPRRKLRRVVAMHSVEELMPAFERRIGNGFLYGDFQFAIDSRSDDFLRKGILSCYEPVPLDTPIPPRKKLSTGVWMDLVHAAHTQPAEAFERYASYYQATSGQVYWSDLHQFSNYRDNYHAEIDRRMRTTERASEVITEIYVPRGRLTQFMMAARDSLRQHQATVIYGTIRLIERDDESFLAWARESYACVIFNLHTVHTPGGIRRSADAFRSLIDLAVLNGGSYYLTYHKFATRQQLEACHPRFPEFLAMKKQFDPDQRFQSDWYRHYQRA